MTRASSILGKLTEAKGKSSLSEEMQDEIMGMEPKGLGEVMHKMKERMEEFMDTDNDQPSPADEGYMKKMKECSEMMVKGEKCMKEMKMKEQEMDDEEPAGDSDMDDEEDEKKKKKK